MTNNISDPAPITDMALKYVIQTNRKVILYGKLPAFFPPIIFSLLCIKYFLCTRFSTMPQNTALIITSISAPNAAMRSFADGCLKSGIDFLVVGDSKSPKDFNLRGCRFVGIEEQRGLPFKLAKLLPEKHYGRKNLGYLLSKDKEEMIETDDDNLPRPEFWNKNLDFTEARVIEEQGWVNAYHYFSKENIWPRGFPLEELQNGNRNPKEIQKKKFPTHPLSRDLQMKTPMLMPFTA